MFGVPQYKVRKYLCYGHALWFMFISSQIIVKRCSQLLRPMLIRRSALKLGILRAQLGRYVHKGDLKPHLGLFHFI